MNPARSKDDLYRDQWLRPLYPPFAVSNEALVAAFNQYVDLYNEENASAIDAGQLPAKQHSSSEFIEKASGIKSRYLVSKEGVLDPDIMQPLLPERPDDKPSIMVEMAVAAAEQALIAAGREPGEIDLVIVAASNMPRPYPALSIELQHYLGAGGMAFDMNVACSSATFGIKTAADMLVLAAPNWRWWSIRRSARGTSTSAIGTVTSSSATPVPPCCWSGRPIARRPTLATGGQQAGDPVLQQHPQQLRLPEPTQPAHPLQRRQAVPQQGRKVFKEVLPLVCDQIAGQLDEQGWAADTLSRLWLHQANLTMNQFIARKLLGHDASQQEAPVILDSYGNTSSAGSIIAFHLYNRDLSAGPAACSARSGPVTPSAACCSPVCKGPSSGKQQNHPNGWFLWLVHWAGSMASTRQLGSLMRKRTLQSNSLTPYSLSSGLPFL